MIGVKSVFLELEEMFAQAVCTLRPTEREKEKPEPITIFNHYQFPDLPCVYPCRYIEST